MIETDDSLFACRRRQPRSGAASAAKTFGAQPARAASSRLAGVIARRSEAIQRKECPRRSKSQRNTLKRFNLRKEVQFGFRCFRLGFPINFLGFRFGRL